MATYLQDGVGIFPQEQGFTPNYNFIMRTLELRQNQYDQGFAQVKSIYNSVLNADLLKEENKERRDLIIANAEKALKDLPMIDLSIAKNVSTAKSVFKPFYEDDDILWDMTQTKDIKGQISRGSALQYAEKEEERKRYWGTGIQDLYDWIDEFKAASLTDARGMRARRYVGKPQVADEIFTLFKEGKLKVTVDKLSGMEKITYENGQESVIPLTNLYISKVQNDPEALEGFNVYGRVQRNRFIKENVANGVYGTREEAAAAHDKSLINDYTSLQDKGITQSTSALNIVKDNVKSLQKKLADGTLTETEARQLANAELEAEALEKKIKEYEINKQNAPSLIERNPSGFLGQIYMHKSASDLAIALSSVSMSKKIESNPIYKDFIFSKEMEEYKNQLAIRLEEAKSGFNMNEERLKAQLKDLYGDYDGSGGSGSGGGGPKGGPNKKELMIPEVRESFAASGVEFRTPDGKPDAYRQFVQNKKEVAAKYSETKAGLIFDVLSPNELVDDKGNLLNQNQMRAILGNGALLDKLYAKAVTKMANYATSDPEKYNRLNSVKLQADNLNNAWLAMDKQGEAWLKEIIGNLESTETYPERVEEYERLSTAKEASNVYVKEKRVIPGKNEGWLYKHLVKPNGTFVSETDVNAFLEKTTKDKNFEGIVNKRFAENVAKYYARVATADPRSLFTSIPTYEQTKTQVTNEFKEKFGEYRKKVLDKWNDRGLNFMTQYAPIPGGGGTTSRVLTYTGSNKVSGEPADVFVQDLLTKLPSIGGGDKDMFVVAGADKPDGAKSSGDKELKTLIMNGVLSNEIMNSIKLGKDSDLKGYRFTTSMVGGSDPNYHAYTLTFDADFIAKMKGTEDKPGLIGPSTADKLVNGITIYLKKDKDNTLASQKSTMGEIDILVNTHPQGTLQKEVIPGYGLTITKNQMTGGYKIVSYYPKYTAQNLDGVPTEDEVIVPAGTDLSSAYYQTVNDLIQLYSISQKTKDDFIKNQPKKLTREDIDRMKNQGAQ